MSFWLWATTRILSLPIKGVCRFQELVFLRNALQWGTFCNYSINRYGQYFRSFLCLSFSSVVLKGADNVLDCQLQSKLFFFFFSISLSRRKLHKNDTEKLKNFMFSQWFGKLRVYNFAENIATPLPRFICTRNILIGKARTRNHAIERVSLHSLAVNANLPNNLAKKKKKAHYTWFKTTLVSDPWK